MAAARGRRGAAATLPASTTLAVLRRAGVPLAGVTAAQRAGRLADAWPYAASDDQYSPDDGQVASDQPGGRRLPDAGPYAAADDPLRSAPGGQAAWTGVVALRRAGC